MWVKKVLKSFRYALEGLKYTVVTQRNMRIHFFVALAVLLLSLYLPLNKMEVLVLFVTIILVIFAELINTAIEAVVDMITEEFHPLAKIAKDVAAGAVLLTAGLAVIVGLSVFYPYLNQLFHMVWTQSPTKPNIGLAAIIVFDFFFTLLLKGWFHRMGKKEWEPSMIISVAFCVATLVVALIWNLMITFLVYFLTTLLLVLRFRMDGNRVAILFGAIIGILVAVVGFQWL
ncbi:diacylglycerol kinase [Thermoflavimicrobium dichotomicum]|uniref:Diacylglycerol kinase (ATP) n=1 Tax=Thermoflavimicrobium dichotomicum TaxID=46223 RepID=A0A1I3NII4_9BACL|nr:diacylglycerol kinase family protein [Thermoflavimicrobium dichotomicum]SFJ08780.1 diacylglycerol kinase (ATP) [Thermoflavimicrobium dichotomicum]